MSFIALKATTAVNMLTVIKCRQRNEVANEKGVNWFPFKIKILGEKLKKFTVLYVFY